MAATFLYDDVQARTALQRMKRARDGLTACAGDDWTQGAMGALLDAEFLAAQAGIVPWVTLPTGEQGLITVGAARERISQAPEDVRTIYLATHGLVRSTHALAAPWGGQAPQLEGFTTGNELAPPIGAIPIAVIALTVIAIAAVVGTAWYFQQKATIQVEGRNLRTTAVASEVAALAREQLALTGHIDPEIWQVFKDIAAAEAESNWLPWAIGGVVLVGGGVAAYSWWRKQKGNHP